MSTLSKFNATATSACKATWNVEMYDFAISVRFRGASAGDGGSEHQQSSPHGQRCPAGELSSDGMGSLSAAEPQHFLQFLQHGAVFAWCTQTSITSCLISRQFIAQNTRDCWSIPIDVKTTPARAITRIAISCRENIAMLAAGGKWGGYCMDIDFRLSQRLINSPASANSLVSFGGRSPIGRPSHSSGASDSFEAYPERRGDRTRSAIATTIASVY
jgi:hypothetical protein